MRGGLSGKEDAAREGRSQLAFARQQRPGPMVENGRKNWAGGTGVTHRESQKELADALGVGYVATQSGERHHPEWATVLVGAAGRRREV